MLKANSKSVAQKKRRDIVQVMAGTPSDVYGLKVWFSEITIQVKEYHTGWILQLQGVEYLPGALDLPE